MATGKREREDDQETGLGFGEHRAKRILPLRQSLEFLRQPLSGLAYAHTTPTTQSIADITPNGSDTEMSPRAFEPKSTPFPWSSPAMSSFQNSPSSPYRTQQLSGPPAHSDDMDMMDNSSLHPGYLRTEDLKSTTGHVPTPINSHFSHARYNLSQPGCHLGYLGGELDRRLPSPISEDDKVPNTMLEGMSGMQVDENTAEEKITPRKGHTRSKHNLREWNGYPHEPGGIKKFSMGYKSDCEKCRLKIPGHFSHVLTYPNDYDWTKDD